MNITYGTQRAKFTRRVTFVVAKKLKIDIIGPIHTTTEQSYSSTKFNK